MAKPSADTTSPAPLYDGDHVNLWRADGSGHRVWSGSKPNRCRVLAGPLREPQDLLFPRYALEVKTVGETSKVVEIHGVAQLDAPGVPLALVVATLAESDSGQTLPALVAEVTQRSADKAEIRRRLKVAGYVSTDADEYPQRFDVVSIETVPVGAETPRIVPSSFEASASLGGVNAVQYTIDMLSLRAGASLGVSALREWTEAQT